MPREGGLGTSRLVPLFEELDGDPRTEMQSGRGGIDLWEGQSPVSDNPCSESVWSLAHSPSR